MFKTPRWIIDTEIINRIEYSGSVERIRSLQVATLNNILSLGRMARMIENETHNGDSAYKLTTMMQDLRKSVWNELKSGRKIDTYRRNLQRAYIDGLGYLMIAKDPIVLKGFLVAKATTVNVSQSDIRAVVRAELNTLKRSVKAGIGRAGDAMSSIHLQDAIRTY